MPILQSHRSYIYLLERTRVTLKNGRIVYSEKTPENEVEHNCVMSWNIPSLNTTCLLLGQGTSISQPAVRKLADDGMMLGFVGSEGTPFFCGSMNYRPTERLQKWIKLWPNPEWRLAQSKYMQLCRCRAVNKAWECYRQLDYINMHPDEYTASFQSEYKNAVDVNSLLLTEARYTKELYKIAARGTGAVWYGREHGKKDINDRANSFLDHGNYLAYGLAGVCLWSLGIPESLAITHGKTRNGGLIFDLADTIKDAIILPTAFQYASDYNKSDQDYRQEVVRRLMGAKFLNKHGALGFMYDIMDSILEYREVKNILCKKDDQ